MDKYHYDNEIDAVSIRCDEYEYAYSLELTEDINLDLNKKHVVIGLEILDASEVLHITPNYLISPKKVVTNLNVDDKGILINLTFINTEEKTFTGFIEGLFENKLNSSFITA